MILRVRPTPTRFPTEILYAPLDITPLRSAPIVGVQADGPPIGPISPNNQKGHPFRGTKHIPKTGAAARFAPQGVHYHVDEIYLLP